MTILFIIIIILLVAADQATKLVMLSWLKPQGTVELVPGFIRFRFVENEGAAFSMLNNARWFFIIVTAVCVVFCMVALFSKKAKLKYPSFNSPF